MENIIHCSECKYYCNPVCTFYGELTMTSRSGFCHHAIRGEYTGDNPPQVRTGRLAEMVANEMLTKVIHCGECRFSMTHTKTELVHVCKCGLNSDSMWMSADDDFCSQAERRAEG